MKHFAIGVLMALALFFFSMLVGFAVGSIEGEDGGVVTITHEASVLMKIDPQAAAASGAAGAAR